MRLTKQPVNVIALVKPDGEKYVFVFTEEQAKDVLQTIGRFAGNPELSFSWTDAATVSQRLREPLQ